MLQDFLSMKILVLAGLFFVGGFAYGDAPDVAIPEWDIALIKTTDYVEVVGTNELGGAENFSIHNAQAIKQFVDFLTSDRYTAVPKSLKPEFKSLSIYKVRLSSRGAVVLELQIIAESILDIPGEADYYMQSDRHSDNIMAPLLRLR
jgi:hypothetical protein